MAADFARWHSCFTKRNEIYFSTLPQPHFKSDKLMANQDKFGGIRDRLSSDNLVKNDRESALLHAKLANLDDQQRKEIARWEREKNQVRLPIITTLANRERTSLTPPSSPTAKVSSPVFQHSRVGDIDILASAVNGTKPAATVGKTVEFPHRDKIFTFDSVANCFQKSKSFQSIRLNVSQQSPRGLRSASPAGLHSRSTVGQVRSRNSETNSLPKPESMPSIQVEDRAVILNAKVKKFNENVQIFTSKANQGRTTMQPSEDPPASAHELLIPQRPTIAHRWKSLPTLFQAAVSDGKSPDKIPSCDDMKQCRYLRTPNVPTLSIEEVFDKDR